MLTTSPNVPQISLPGQAAAPPGPCDLTPMYLMHHAFRRDLRRFGDAVATTSVADRRTWRALDGRWRRFARILHHHHTGEDEILWPMLLARVGAVGDEHGRAVLVAMEAEHEEIDPLLAGCAAGFERLAAGPDEDTRAALVVRVAATAERLGHHLGHEESAAMVLLQAHLTPAEWTGMDAGFAAHYSPRDTVFAVSWVLDGVPDTVRRTVLRTFPAPLALAWRTVLRWPHEWRERRIFRVADRRTVGMV
jgi:hypothetical protein